MAGILSQNPFMDIFFFSFCLLSKTCSEIEKPNSCQGHRYALNRGLFCSFSTHTLWVAFCKVCLTHQQSKYCLSAGFRSDLLPQNLLQPQVLLRAPPQQGSHRGAAVQRGSGATEPSDEGGADHAHQRGLQVLTGSAGDSAGRAAQPHDDSAAS